MRYLIDEFKKAATSFEGYSRIMRPMTYTCFEDAVCFTTRSSNLELQIIFNQINDSDDIQFHVSIKFMDNLGGTHDRVLSNYLKHEGDNIVKFTYQEVNSTYAALFGIQLIEYPESAHSLIELIDRSKNVISNFINEINDRELIRSHYQKETNMSDEKPKVTPEQIDDLLSRSYIEYARFDNTLTIGVAKLPSGFKVTGQSSCANPADFDKERGETGALKDIHAKLWEYEVYRVAHEHREEKVRKAAM